MHNILFPLEQEHAHWCSPFNWTNHAKTSPGGDSRYTSNNVDPKGRKDI